MITFYDSLIAGTQKRKMILLLNIILFFLS